MYILKAPLQAEFERSLRCMVGVCIIEHGVATFISIYKSPSQDKSERCLRSTVRVYIIKLGPNKISSPIIALVITSCLFSSVSCRETPRRPGGGAGLSESGEAGLEASQCSGVSTGACGADSNASE